MDIVQDYVSLLHYLLPSTITNPLINFTTTTYGIIRALQVQLSPLLTRVVTQPDIASVLALVVILWFSMKIVGMALRSVLFWFSLAWTVVKWGFLAGLGFWIYQRGFDGAVEDAQHLIEVWSGEYEKFQGRAQAYKSAEDAQIRLQAGQRRASQQKATKGWW